MTREEIQAEALRATVGVKSAGLGLATGVGKTLVGLSYLKREMTPLKTALIVAPSRSIFTTWNTEAVKFKMQGVMTNVRFSTYLSLNKHDPLEYDVVILDECHSLKYSHHKFLDEFCGKILGLTGTPPKDTRSEKGKMVHEFCPIVYEYLTDDAVGDSILNDYKIIVHELQLDTDNTIPVTAKGKTFYTSEKKNYDYWTGRLENASSPKELQMLRVMRMRALMSFVSKEKYTKLLADSIKTKCLIFANTQEQADKLCTHTYHSNNPNSKDNLNDFKAGKINKLSCVMQLSEGVNIPELRQSIIMHAYGNERKSAQRIGRCLRLSPNETAVIHILCYMGTVDETWVKGALEGFSDEKIIWKNYNIKLN